MGTKVEKVDISNMTTPDVLHIISADSTFSVFGGELVKT